MKNKFISQKSLSHTVFALIILSSFLMQSCASQSHRNDTSQLPFRYSTLKVMDLDQMSEMMQDKAKEFKKTDNTQALKDGLLICFARPDEDAVVEKILSTIRTPLDDNGLWESAVEELVDKSLQSVKEDQLSPADQVTYSVVLENIISEFKPAFVKQYKSPGFETKIIEKIAKADAELSTVAKSERKLNLMKGSFAPSAVAQKLIDHREEALEKEKEREKESAKK